MPEPWQWLHNKNITCTSLCIKEQFGDLSAKEPSLATFITSYLRWPSARYDFSAAKLPGTLMSENKSERGKILFVPKPGTRTRKTHTRARGRVAESPASPKRVMLKHYLALILVCALEMQLSLEE